jgi:predicted transcriptional regulator
LTYIVKRTQIYLDDEQEARLDRRARATGVTRSALIRAAVDAFLASDKPLNEVDDALGETAGALPNLEVPSRDEWARRG